MLNLDVALSSFWQLARHWKNGQKAKLELNSEDANLYIQLSATLGKPDHVHFPAPFLLSQHPEKGSHPPNYADKRLGGKKPLPKLTKLFLQQKLPPNILKKKFMRKLKLK